MIKAYLVRLGGLVATRLVVGCVASNPAALRDEIETLVRGLQRLDRCSAFGVGSYAKTLLIEAHGPHAVMLAVTAAREVGGDRTVLVFDLASESYVTVARHRDSSLKLGTLSRAHGLEIEAEFDQSSATYLTCDRRAA